MEVVLVGLPGSGKSAVGRRLAAQHGAAFLDLDAEVERVAGRAVAEIFEREGEAGFRRRESEAIARLGAAEDGAALRRVVATGGGAVVDPRNRWRLYRGRRVVWLDSPAPVLARRLRYGRTRPLLAGRDPVAALEELRGRRARFYAAGSRVDGVGSPADVAARVDRALTTAAGAETVLLRAAAPVGRLELGEGNAEGGIQQALAELGRERLALVSEPEAWRLHGERLCRELVERGSRVEPVLMQRAEEAKTFGGLEQLLRELARRRFEREDPVVALGGGALGDAAGFAAATYLRGVPLVHVPTTLLAQIDSAIGGKTAIDLPEGKNLVGAFHLPRAVVVDLGFLRTLPPRQLRAALGEAAKYAALGDERLFALLEQEGGSLARGDVTAAESGALAELVERCAWRKVEVVTADGRDEGERVVLNLGHSLGHAIEAAGGYGAVLHGEAVAYGLRGAIAVGRAVGVTPAERAERLEALLDELGLAVEPPGVEEAAVRGHLAADKKHADGRLRWVLLDGSGVTVRSDVPDAAVDAGVAAALRRRR